MRTWQQIVALLKSTRIDWDATPQSALGPPEAAAIRSPRDLRRIQEQRACALVGCGVFYIDVRNGRAELALMRCTRLGWWETEIIPRALSPLREEDLIRAVEEAGGALNRSDAYPLDDVCRWKLQASYLNR